MEKTAVIIDNGDFPKKEYPRYLLRNADYVVCCDGALTKYFRNMEAVFGKERMPDAVIGDMDSLSGAARKRYTGPLVHVTCQETNDQTKAVEYVMSNFTGISAIYILGGSGAREDHTIGNMALLMEFAGKYPGLDISAVSDYGTAFVITESGEIHCGEGRSVSIFTCDTTLRIKSSGLEWPTDDVVFDNWWKATLNRASADTVRLELDHPAPVLIILN